MKAVVVEQAGGVDQLKTIEVDRPTPSTSEVLIDVKAISINPVDFKVRGNTQVMQAICGTDKNVILGWDIAGTVVEVAGGNDGFEVGDDVFGMVNFPGVGSAYAELVAAPKAHLAKKPENVPFEDAAAATLAALTAWQALVVNGKVRSGQKILVQAASGGVGHYAVQIAKYLGAYVTGISSGRNKEFIMSLGADAHIDYTQQNFEEVLSDQDFVLDALGGENIQRSMNVVAKDGTLISLPSPIDEATQEEAKTKGIDAQFMMVRSNGEHMAEIAALLGTGKIKSHIQQTFAFDQIGDAHLQLESGRTTGKVVVTV